MCWNVYGILLASSLMVSAVLAEGIVGNDSQNHIFDLVFPNYEQVALAVPTRLLLPGLPSEKVYNVATYSEANWFVAQQVCGYHGLSLASITTEADNQRIQKFITDNGLSGHEFWLSGTTLSRQGRWVWFNIGRPFTYTNWDVGRPSIDKFRDVCVVLKANGTWADVPCYRQRFFICETRCELDSYQVPVYNRRR